jgi:hypothetical protein
LAAGQYGRQQLNDMEFQISKLSLELTRFNSGLCRVGKRRERMHTKNTWAVTLGVLLLLVVSSVDGQQTVYKWVDKEGVVHFTDAPPDASEAAEFETLATAAPPTPSNATSRPPSPVEPTEPRETSEVQPADKKKAPGRLDITAMSLDGLDRRCEDAREEKIAPLRQAEIANCKKQEGKDPAWCERFYVDYGAGGNTEFGGYRQRMFHDLPECIDADQERRRRF